MKCAPLPSSPVLVAVLTLQSDWLVDFGLGIDPAGIMVSFGSGLSVYYPQVAPSPSDLGYR